MEIHFAIRTMRPFGILESYAHNRTCSMNQSVGFWRQCRKEVKVHVGERFVQGSTSAELDGVCLLQKMQPESVLTCTHCVSERIHLRILQKQNMQNSDGAHLHLAMHEATHRPMSSQCPCDSLYPVSRPRVGRGTWTESYSHVGKMQWLPKTCRRRSRARTPVYRSIPIFSRMWQFGGSC